jgi:hypothetical protein
MKKKSPASGDSAIDLLEEAVHLLRGAPARLLGIYALGTLPFVLALLYFWADMSRGAFAREHADRGAAAMGLFFLWMKCWQAVFAAGLRSQRTGQAGAPWTARRAGWLVLQQSALQPSGLFALPVAFVVMLPLPWVCSFYQNLTALGVPAESGGLRGICTSAARQASTRPGQNHLLMGLLSVFSLFVWLNVAITMAWLPYLLKTLFGLDTAFTHAGMIGVFNTTYLACSFALTYIFVDPLVKAVFVLRCFYGQSLQTGDDLKSDLARVRETASLSMSMLAALVFFFLAIPVVAAPAMEAPPPAAAVSPAELNHSIDEVLQRPEFAWRMPREEAKDSDSGEKTWFARAIGAMVDMLKDAMQYCLTSIGKSLKWLWEQLLKLVPNSSPDVSSPFGWMSAWASFLRIVLLILILVVAGILAVLIFRLWQRRRQPHAVAATAIAARPDLNDENIAANQLPEEDWLKMAREMIAAGNLRLALRAFYLAGLANLAAREMIAIAIFKSNREYENELRRRARALPAVQNAFSQNVAAFDRAWYGLHEVTQEALQQFQSNLEQIRSS